MKAAELTGCNAQPHLDSAFALTIVTVEKFRQLIGIQASWALAIIFDAVTCLVNISFEQMLAI